MADRLAPAGHLLVNGGRMSTFHGLTGGRGSAQCSCGDRSPSLQSTAARRRWHHDHKAEVVTELADAVATRSPYVLFDVDGVLLGLEGLAPGAAELMTVVARLGYRVAIWTAGGRPHAREVGERLGLSGVRFLRKPDYPIQEHAALALLGYRPFLQLDDDSTERVAEWPFIRVRSAITGGRPGEKSLLEIAELLETELGPAAPGHGVSTEVSRG